MSGITYFKLKSPYEGDITKNCALTGLEVDNNFFTLEGRDVKSVEVADGKIVVNLLNGEKLTTEDVTEGCIKGLSIGFDAEKGILTVTKNGETSTITGFVTEDIIDAKIPTLSVSTKESLIGNGTAKSPVGISPVHKTGQYRPVKSIIKLTDKETLPTEGVSVGDRYLSKETTNDFGYLYNYEGLKEIARHLKEAGSEWRVPTKEDWDDMLNAVEPNETGKTHSDARSNKYLGEFAGKMLKSKEYWKEDTSSTNVQTTCACGKDVTCSPTYCGEYGTCHCKCDGDNSGIGAFGFNVLPAGYANEAKDFLYFKERAYFWTASNHEYRDAYIKAFVYNKSTVLQDIMAADNYMSVRLVKDYNGSNFFDSEDILGTPYSTVLMPSTEHGSAIWTSVNLSSVGCVCDCCTKYVLPNDGQGMTYTTKYFTNEWMGGYWLRKELADGESVVVKDGEDNKTHREYRVVNGELVDVSDMIYNNVIETLQPKFDDIEKKVQDVTDKFDKEISDVNDKVDEEVSKINDKVGKESERITKVEQDIATVNDNLVISVNTINKNMADGFNTINENVAQGFNTINEAIEAERQIRDNKDKEIESKLLTSDGTSFDKDNGVLTLKSNGGTNDVQLQFAFNFGTF